MADKDQDWSLRALCGWDILPADATELLFNVYHHTRRVFKVPRTNRAVIYLGLLGGGLFEEAVGVDLGLA